VHVSDEESHEESDIEEPQYKKNVIEVIESLIPEAPNKAPTSNYVDAILSEPFKVKVTEFIDQDWILFNGDIVLKDTVIEPSFNDEAL
jgi:hypothetical protein